MFVVTNRIPVAPGWEEQFETRFRNRAHAIGKQAGFVRMEVLRPVSKDTPYAVVTVWEDQPAFQAWIASEDFRDAHRNPLPKDAFTGDGRLEQHELVVSG
jgi:heme-degrading monooxygenase HmoA